MKPVGNPKGSSFINNKDTFQNVKEPEFRMYLNHKYQMI